MNNEEQEKLQAHIRHERMHQEKTAGMANGATIGGGVLGGYALQSDMDQPCRVGLLERVIGQRREAQRSSRKADRLSELQELLMKNPEVARILDLIEEVRG